MIRLVLLLFEVGCPTRFHPGSLSLVSFKRYILPSICIMKALHYRHKPIARHSSYRPDNLSQYNRTRKNKNRVSLPTNRKTEMERLHCNRWKPRHHFAKTQTFRYVSPLVRRDGPSKQWHAKTDVSPTKISCRGCRFLLPGQTSKASACAAPAFDG